MSCHTAIANPAVRAYLLAVARALDAAGVDAGG